VVHFAPQSAPAIGLRHLAHFIVSSNKARDFGKPMKRNAFGNMASVGQSDLHSEEEG
jgi:hypothetical protein